MHKLFEPLALGTNLFKGYSLEEALSYIASCGFEYVEIASIANMCEHVAPKDMSGEKAAEVKKLIEKVGLKTYAFAGHVDLTVESDLKDFLKKIEFAAAIGAKIINTNSGPLSRLAEFRENMKKIITQAERFNMKIGLESHGDIIGTAKESVKYLKEFNHPLVRFNYDTGNTYFYSKGHVDVAEDIKYCFEYLEHIHLKDISIKGNVVRYCKIGEGDINFAAVAESLKSLGKPLPAGLEIPVFMHGTIDLLSSADAPLPIELAKSAARDSKKYLENLQERR
ncbi:putative AP endonuclease family 2 [uncultured spirochete]|uniref:Putative AP endonuclease family 2 n=1 Tax=uncultured spirochete TaxID=156406 RepID=A0A3P3XN46_9SPIR|nr:putative AP endonuclease family 2 [uncultured spirochete]